MKSHEEKFQTRFLIFEILSLKSRLRDIIFCMPFDCFHHELKIVENLFYFGMILKLVTLHSENLRIVIEKEPPIDILDLHKQA